MAKALLERRLIEISERLKDLRRELTVAEEQLSSLADMADDARLRSLVSETPLAGQEMREAQKHADAMSRHRSDLQASIRQLEAAQDELLDRLYGST